MKGEMIQSWSWTQKQQQQCSTLTWLQSFIELTSFHRSEMLEDAFSRERTLMATMRLVGLYLPLYTFANAP